MNHVLRGWNDTRENRTPSKEVHETQSFAKCLEHVLCIEFAPNVPFKGGGCKTKKLLNPSGMSQQSNEK